MPNQTLYDNFSQVRQYIDQEKPDLSSYVTKSELSNCGYLTSIPSEYITQQELSGNSYATTSELSNYLPLTGGTLNGNLTLGNTYFLTVGTQRAWKLFEDGSGGGAYIALQNTVHSKSFYIKDETNNDLVQVLSRGNTSDSKLYLTNKLQSSYTQCAAYFTSYTRVADGIHIGDVNYIWNNGTSGLYVTRNGINVAAFMAGTTNKGIAPPTTNTYYLGNSSQAWLSTYTKNLYLNGTNIIDTVNGIFSYDSSTGTLSITTIS